MPLPVVYRGRSVLVHTWESLLVLPIFLLALGVTALVFALNNL